MTFEEIPGSGAGPQGSDAIVAKLVADVSEFVASIKSATEGAVQQIQKVTGAVTQFDEATRKGAQFLTDATKGGFFGGGTWDKVYQTLSKQSDATLQQLGITREEMDKGAAALEKYGAEVLKTDKKTKTWQQTLKATAKALIGLGAIQVARKIINFMKEAVDVAMRLNFEQYKLEVGIRAAQRRFGEAAGTMKEWAAFIQELRTQFRIFSTVDLTAATGKVVLLTRELEFTKEQMMEVTKASIALAEVSGKTVEDAARRLALFLDTGYSRGLAQLGVQISRVTVENYAMAHGFKGTYSEMTRSERATWALKAAMEQIAPIMEDAGRAAETFQGQMMEMQAAQTDAMAALGTSFAPMVLAWQRIKTTLLTQILPAISWALTNTMQFFILFWSMIVAGYTTLLAFLIKFRNPFRNALRALTDPEGLKKDLLDISKIWQDTFKQMVGDLNRSFFAAGSLGDVAADEFGSMANSLEDAADEMGKSADEIVKEVFDKVQEAMQDFRDKNTDTWQDYVDEVLDINRKYKQDLEDLQIELYRDLEDLQTKYNQDRADLIREESEDASEAKLEQRNREKEMMDEYRLREVQAQREFNLEMEQLERQYLMNLEDAVRERDARGILMLQRKYNEDVQTRTENFEEEKRQRWENLQLELAQLRAQEQIKAIERRNALNAKLRDLDEELKREIAERNLAFLRELEDQKRANARRREEAWIDYELQMRDNQIQYERRLRDIGAQLMAEYNLTKDGLDSVYELYIALYGPSGALDRLYAGAVARMIAMQQAAQKALNQAQQFNVGSLSPIQQANYGTGPGAKITKSMPKGFAEGGAMIANKPTQAVFGEQGREMAAFIPLDKLGDVLGGMMGRPDRGSGSKIALDITVKPDPRLNVEITEDVMNSMADVMLTLRKERVVR